MVTSACDPGITTPTRVHSHDTTVMEYDTQFFQDWIDRLRQQWQQKFPVTLIQQQDGDGDTFQRACRSLLSIVSATQEMTALRDHLGRTTATASTNTNTNTTDQDATLDTAVKQCLQTETTAVQQAWEVAMTAGQFLLQHSTTLQQLVQPDMDDTELMRFVIMEQMGASRMAAWCQTTTTTTTTNHHPPVQSQRDQFLCFLQDPSQIPLQRQFLQAGGARQGEYGRAVQLYHILVGDTTLTRSDQTTTATNHPVLHRLAIAIALELASPLESFASPSIAIDPIQRYVHYEQAYLFGELDPAFDTFTVWQMRMIVNSNASDTELGWGRQCLRNYRPDLVTTSDPQWRYCRIVRTDVNYQDPEWYKEPRSYDQILSGGGKCGPRAWYGRFICKAFGIPTWGVQQPGHAAMTRWTTQGWMVCLGAGFEYSKWEGRGGVDFLLETQAREALNDRSDHHPYYYYHYHPQITTTWRNGQDDENADSILYLQKVLRLEWIALLYKEDGKSIWDQCLPSLQSPFLALALMQRKWIAKGSTSIDHSPRSVEDSIKAAIDDSYQDCDTEQNESGNHLVNRNHLNYYCYSSDNHAVATIPRVNHKEEAKEYSFPHVRYNLHWDSHEIIIPSSYTSKPTQETKQVLFPESFLGGRQLVLCGAATVEYTLPLDLVLSPTDTRRDYNLKLMVCTVHRHQNPLKLTVQTISQPKFASDIGDEVMRMTTATDFTIDPPYTMGMWEETEPVTISLGENDVTNSVVSTCLSFTRTDTLFAISIKEIRLMPV